VDAEPQTEPMVATVPTMAKKVEQDQRVTAKRSRTGENRPCRLNLTELDFGWRAGRGRVPEAVGENGFRGA